MTNRRFVCFFLRHGSGKKRWIASKVRSATRSSRKTHGVALLDPQVGHAGLVGVGEHPRQAGRVHVHGQQVVLREGSRHTRWRRGRGRSRSRARPGRPARRPAVGSKRPVGQRPRRSEPLQPVTGEGSTADPAGRSCAPARGDALGRSGIGAAAPHRAVGARRVVHLAS